MAVGGDRDVIAPRRERQRHAQRATSVADHHDAYAARIVAVAVGTDVRVRAVHLLQTRDVGPDVNQADRPQQTSRLQRITPGEMHGKAVIHPSVVVT